jgi:hypothetical protein
MHKTLGMPIAIATCFAIGLILAQLSSQSATLAAFFLAVGLTCLTYSYLGGQLNSANNEGSGTIGILSFKLGGSIVSFLVSFLFLSHHLNLSRGESARNVSLKSGLDNIKLEADSHQIGTIRGNQLGDWARKLARDDYFHPALIAARRPYCENDPAQCVSLAGFSAVAARNPKVQPGTILLCQVDRNTDSDDAEYSEVSLALSNAVSFGLLNQLEVQGEAMDRSLSDAQTMKAIYAESGGFGNQCRRIKASPSNQSPVIRIAALVNPEDMTKLHLDSSNQDKVLKISFVAKD